MCVCVSATAFDVFMLRPLRSPSPLLLLLNPHLPGQQGEEGPRNGEKPKRVNLLNNIGIR